MKNYTKYFMVLAVALTFILTGGIASAIPSLQLDIPGGYYDTTTETIMSSGPVFNLYAYLQENNQNLLADTYFISAALVPPTSNSADLGSFTMNGVTYDVTADMTFGTPPLDALYPDLPSHGIYDTYYVEIPFTFSGATTAAYDTQTGESTPGSMYYSMFSVDTTNLVAGNYIHFDLYNENIRSANDKTYTNFAPFSHDAQSDGHKVPEPSMLWLMGMGLLGLGFFGRKRKLN